MYDVVIIGGGPSGLSASLILGRCNRKILVIDDKRYRNSAVRFAHGFLSRDHFNPLDLSAIARDQISKYKVKFINETVVDIEKQNIFTVKTNKKSYLARKIILATGLKDILPKIEGLAEFYGKSIFHCPYCDGWENNNKKIAVHGEKGVNFAIFIKNWSKDITLFTDGKILSKKFKDKLVENNIKLVEEKVIRFVGKNDRVEFIELKSSKKIKIDVVFLKLKKGQEQRSHLAEKLGLDVTKENGIKTYKYGRTKISGVYAIGDATKDLSLIGMGVAEGIQVAIKINKEIIKENDQKEKTS